MFSSFSLFPNVLRNKIPYPTSDKRRDLIIVSRLNRLQWNEKIRTPTHMYTRTHAHARGRSCVCACSCVYPVEYAYVCAKDVYFLTGECSCIRRLRRSGISASCKGAYVMCTRACVCETSPCQRPKMNRFFQRLWRWYFLCQMKGNGPSLQRWLWSKYTELQQILVSDLPNYFLFPFLSILHEK